MTTARNTSACPVLTGPNNFQIWKLWIISKLRQEKVLRVVTGEELNWNGPLATNGYKKTAPGHRHPYRNPGVLKPSQAPPYKLCTQMLEDQSNQLPGKVFGTGLSL
ncbi:hypothetical protein SERLA73DRAFT_80879 [Serpula lacrymans var. lacrymans S7.3]|uniref:Uncharacterized protein n=1 Tax=Serpula lacrymans var. lacrymans (strain S7.3) TaxID=936435 RepID=F8QKE9_SERL3|nr:hypothetical protein SERLA73DRAFT_80879 [Serpula lacrymans var. lacrymans S7.3]